MRRRTCNEIDDNCDGNIDEDVSLPFYADFDGDEYGDGNNILYACTLPSGYVQNTLDCNDSDSQINRVVMNTVTLLIMTVMEKLMKSRLSMAIISMRTMTMMDMEMRGL